MGIFDDLTGKVRRLRADAPPTAEAIRRFPRIAADAALAVVDAAKAGRLPEDLAKAAHPARRNAVADDAAWAFAGLPLAWAWKRGALGDTANADDLAKPWLRPRR